MTMLKYRRGWVWVCALTAIATGWGDRPASAVDRDWNQASGVQVYNSASNWTPNGIPTAGDNVTFGLNGDVDIFLGNPSLASNVTFTDGIVEFLDVGGTALNNGGVVTVDDAFAAGLGDAALAILNSAAWDSAGNATVGDTGFGTLTVNNGGEFRSLNLFVGNDTDGTGVVNVDGAGSMLTADAGGAANGIFIGNNGTGTLNVTSGGLAQTIDTVGAADISLGFAADSEGTLNIDGAGSRVVSEDFFVGESGTGHLTVSNGGVMDSILSTSPDGFVGHLADSSGDVTVTGNGSQWNMRAGLIGNAGTATVSIEAGGRVKTTATSLSGDFTIGDDPTGDGKVAVSGSGTADSLLDVDNTLIVGNAGMGVLNIGLDLNDTPVGSGDVVVDVNLFIGNQSGNNFDNQVTVRGADASLAVGNALRVGENGKGRLEVLDGATVTSASAIVGVQTTGQGTALVDGLGSFWNPTVLTVANNGGDATMTISGGALVQTAGPTVGVTIGDDTTSGNVSIGTLTVTGTSGGTASTLNNTAGEFWVGGSNNDQGGTGTLNVEMGAEVFSAGRVVLGYGAGADGTVKVTDPGSRFEANGDRISAGFSGKGTLNVLNGGEVTAQRLVVADTAGGAVDSSVVIDGFLNNGGNGNFGDDDDVVSRIDVTGVVSVGEAARGSLSVQNGGRLISGTGSNNNSTNAAIVGSVAIADGAKATVTGDKSQWIHNAWITVGNLAGNVADPVELNVLDGGFAEFTFIQAAIASGSRAKITVDGAGSTLHLRDARGDAGVVSPGIGDIRMVPGSSNGVAELFVSNGGLVDLDTNLEIGRGAAAGQATVTARDAGTLIDLEGELTVAYSSSTGTLNVEDGAVVDSLLDGFISRVSGTGTANVGAAAGQDVGHSEAALQLGSDLYVAGGTSGNNGSGTATLNINPTGRVTVAGLLRVWNRGVVNLNGGLLEVDEINLNDASSTIPTDPTFDFASGVLRFTTAPGVTLDGTLLEQLLGTSPTLGSGQQLEVVNATTISSTLRLNGGTFSAGTTNPASVANLDFSAGTFNLTASNLTIGAGGLFGDSLEITAAQTVNVSQQVTVDAGGQLIATGNFSSGGMTNNGEVAFIDTTGSGKTVSGAIDNNAGSTTTLIGEITFNDAVSGAGNFFGPGTAIFNGGNAPGDSAAIVSYEGDVELGNANTLFIELGGLTPGSGHDQLAVAGSATLDGAIDVSLIESFSPNLGDLFTILTASSVSGDFDSVRGSAGGNLGYDVIVNPTSVVLEVIVAMLAGDANKDGLVTGADLISVQQNFGDAGPVPLQGDANNDGLVTGADLISVQQNFGKALGATGPNAVPEPATALALLLGSLWLRRRH